MGKDFKEFATEVLIIGGGIAGLNAAIAAREAGAQVTIMDKGGIARSGDIGAGTDHFVAYLEQGEAWDTKEAYLDYLAQTDYGSVNLAVHEAVFCQEIKEAIARMTRIGNRLDDPVTGKFIRTRALGAPGPLTINFKGKDFKVNLAREANRLNCQVLEKVMATKIITFDGRICGALGFNIRTGDFYAVRAKALVLSTGSINRHYQNPSGNAFNTWHSPYNTGDGQAMAFAAGAELANMEYLNMTVVPKGFSAPGWAALAGMGCYFINARGERFLANYHPAAERAPRCRIVEGVLTEIKGGRGPVYVDARHLSSKDISRLKETLSWDKDTFSDYLTQKGLDIAKEPLEMMASEGMQQTSGIKIDERCAASLPGLYAAGDGTDQMHAVSGATTSGYVAGREAAAWAAKVKGLEVLKEKELKDERERVYRPLKTKAGIIPAEFEEVLRRIMWELVGPKRSETSLKTALIKLDKLAGSVAEFMASNCHELMRAQEAQNLFAIGRIVATAGMFRKETRFGIRHNRIDYPETDNENWLGLVLVKKKGEEISLCLSPLKY